MLKRNFSFYKFFIFGINFHTDCPSGYYLFNEYVIRIRNLKQALNHGLVLKKVYKVIKFNENAWLKPNIDMNTDLRRKAKDDLEKTFLI